jgi:hypothetical protein
VSLASLTSDGVQIHAAEELLLPPPQALVILKTQARNEETTHALRRPEVTEMNKIGACGCEALAENGVARMYLVLLELVLDADPGAEVDDLGDLVLVDGVLAAMRQGVAVLHGRHCVLGCLLLPGGNVLAGAGHGLHSRRHRHSRVSLAPQRRPRRTRTADAPRAGTKRGRVAEKRRGGEREARREHRYQARTTRRDT